MDKIRDGVQSNFASGGRKRDQQPITRELPGHFWERLNKNKKLGSVGVLCKSTFVKKFSKLFRKSFEVLKVVVPFSSLI